MTAPRELTLEELCGEARERFGDDPGGWAFVCPICGDVATAADYRAGSVHLHGVGCVGRVANGRGCDYAAFGLVPGPWRVYLPDGRYRWCFPLAVVS